MVHHDRGPVGGDRDYGFHINVHFPNQEIHFHIKDVSSIIEEEFMREGNQQQQKDEKKISYLYSNNNITKFTSVFDFYYADEIPPLYAVLTWIFYKHDIFVKL